MNCATHNDTAAVAFCRTCGKPLCANCTRDVRGVVYCEPCLAARLEGTAPAVGFAPQQAVYPPAGAAPISPRPSSGPNPTVAGILAGFFPFGVGAVYCSQYAKGLAHLLIFGLLIFASDHAGNWDALFGIAIAFFYVYQIIDAVRTARALQEGQPPPDPFGLGQAFSMGERSEAKNIPVVAIVLIGLGRAFLAAHHEHLGVRHGPFLAADSDLPWRMDVRPSVGNDRSSPRRAAPAGAAECAELSVTTVSAIAAACGRSWGRRY